MIISLCLSVFVSLCFKATHKIIKVESVIEVVVYCCQRCIVRRGHSP